MKAVVVYQSLWGNTAAVARAIAEGIGPEARALSTAEASPEAIAGASLIVAGSPLLAFSLPTEAILKSIDSGKAKEKVPPDLSQPSMRSWLDALPRGSARVAAFETRMPWSPGGAVKDIMRRLERSGYTPLAKPELFIVKGKYGPLRDGELERAKAWVAQLARAVENTSSQA